MSRKAFLIWGLVIISFTPIATAVIQYLGLSRIIDINSFSIYLALAYLIGAPIAFGTVLHFRFKEIGRRKLMLALVIPIYIIGGILSQCFSIPYNEHIISESGATERFYGAIGEWSRSNVGGEMAWTIKQKIDFILIMLPMQYIAQLGLFALLWFGSLDPRKPSKNRFVQFMKTGFQLKNTPKAAEITKLAMA